MAKNKEETKDEETPLGGPVDEEQEIKLKVPVPAVKQGGGGDEKDCCSLALDIVGMVFLYIFTIFLLVGGLIVHPKRSYYAVQKIDEPFVFFFLGAACYLATAIIDVVQRRHKGALEISMGSIAIGGGLFWLIGSIFLFVKILKLKVWGGLFIVGCILNLTTITFDMCMVFLKHTNKPLFRAMALKFSFLAHLLFIIGAVQFLMEYDSDVELWCGYTSASGVIASGAVIYLIHAVFHTLSLFLKGITFTVNRSR